jgi:branched-chain amino acid transport system substrate-binding protein
MNKFSVIILGIFTFFFIACKKEQPEPEVHITKIKVAGLFSESDNLAFLGKSSEAAVKIAIRKINADFKKKGINYAFEFTTYNTNANPIDAVAAMESIVSSGCKLVIGPQTSAELSAIKNLADENGVLLVSPSSTSSALSIADDMIYRFSPGETVTGNAMSQFYLNQGKQALVMVSRNDIGSIGIKTTITNHFSNAGGNILDLGEFDITQTDFTTTLDQIRQGISTLSNSYSLAEIGVVTISWDETTQMFNQAASDPILSSVNWYGGIGYFKPQSLILDPIAANFALTTQFSSPGFSLPMSTENIWQPVFDEILETTGVNGYALTMCSYDIMLGFGKLIEKYKTLPKSGSALASAFQNSVPSIHGATGTIMLDNNGDRANGIFDFWGMSSTNGSFSWQLIGQSE